MENKCSIIRDILPLYIENMVSSDTKMFVDGHIAECAQCRAELQQMKKPARFIADTDAAPLKNLKKKLFVKKVQAVIFTAAVALVAVLSAVSVLTAPQYIPYSDGLVSITEDAGKVTMEFDSSVTGYTCQSEIGWLSGNVGGIAATGGAEGTATGGAEGAATGGAEGAAKRGAEGTATGGAEGTAGIEVYHISAWKTVWDQHFTERGTQNMVLSSDKPIAVLYSQNNGAEDVLLYGANPNPDGGTLVLPRLVLGQYFALAVFAAVVLAALLFVCRKKEAMKRCVERIFFLPVSYVLAHLFTKGIAMESYSVPRDFGFIVLAAILVYCVLLLGVSLYRLKKRG